MRFNLIKCVIVFAFAAFASLTLAQATQRAAMPAPGPAIAPVPAIVPPMDRPTPMAGYPQWRDPSQPNINPADLIDQVSCVIQIDSDVDPNYGNRNDAQTATALLTSSTLKDSAIARMSNAKVQNAKQQIQVLAYPTGQQFVRITVLLTKGSETFEPDVAAKLMSALCDSLKSAFEASNGASSQAANSRNDSLQKQLDAARDRFAAVRSKLRQVREGVGGSNYSGYDFDNALSNLMNQKRSNDQELARTRSRLAALDPSAGPLVAEWEQIVKLRQKQLDDIRASQQAGKSSAADVTELEAKLAEAKAQLAAIRGSDARDPNRANRSGEISSLRVSLAEIEERAKNTDEQVARLKDPKMRELQDQLPELQQQEQQLRSEISDLSNRIDQSRRSLRNGGKVTITILDGRPS